MTHPIFIYTDSAGRSSLQVKLDGDTLWLSQKQLTDLFGKAKGTISEHIAHIFEDGELSSEATVRLFRTVQTEGGRQVERTVEHYNLDMILAVGFRVRSPAGVRFRQWANTTIKSYLEKGFVMDDERLKNPDGKRDYFDEMLARIRDIRASEKRFYQKLRELFALSSDYDAKDATVHAFYAQTQNKILYAITGQTAAELIVSRAVASVPNMGLTHWAGAQVRKTDIVVAKNYLTEKEINLLNRFVIVFLETAELRAENEQVTTMDFWRENVDKIIAFNNKPLLQNAGQVSHEAMLELTDTRYLVFDQARQLGEAQAVDAEDLQELKVLENVATKITSAKSKRAKTGLKP